MVNTLPAPNLKTPSPAASVHLDMLRGVAAVAVCVSHIKNILFLDYRQLAHPNHFLAAVYFLTSVSHYWVIVFFVLSGYLVGGSVLRAHAKHRWSWGDYLLKRLTRLYCVLVPALILGGLLDLYGIERFGLGGVYGGHSESYALFFSTKAQLTLPIMLGNYAFLQKILVPVFGSNGPLWSLSYEFWYYLAFPLVAVVLWSATRLRLRIAALALLCIWAAFVGHKIALMGLVWLMGVGIYFLPPLILKSIRARQAVGLALCLAFLGVMAWGKNAQAPLYVDFTLGLVCATLVYFIAGCAQASPPRLYARLAGWLSNMSYTLYLVHMPLLVLFAAWIESRSGSRRWEPSAHTVIYASGIFAIIMVYARLVYVAFEKNTNAVRGWIETRLRALHPPALSLPCRNRPPDRGAERNRITGCRVHTSRF